MIQWSLDIDGVNEIFENGVPNGQYTEYTMALVFDDFDDMIDFIKRIQLASYMSLEYKISRL